MRLSFLPWPTSAAAGCRQGSDGCKSASRTGNRGRYGWRRGSTWQAPIRLPGPPPELQSALINKDVLKANRIVRYFADNKKANPQVMVLSQLFSFFSNLMMYHYLPDKSQGTVASELKINPYFVKDYEKAAKAFGAWKTMNIITWIRETDARGKGIDSNGVEDGDLMKELVYKILH